MKNQIYDQKTHFEIPKSLVDLFSDDTQEFGLYDQEGQFIGHNRGLGDKNPFPLMGLVGRGERFVVRSPEKKILIVNMTMTPPIHDLRRVEYGGSLREAMAEFKDEGYRFFRARLVGGEGYRDVYVEVGEVPLEDIRIG